MTTWTKEELGRIADSDDLHIAALREDGVTYGTLTWSWSVVVDDALYVRAYNGKASSWYQAAMSRPLGRVIAAGMTREVAFDPVEGPIQDRIDDAYREKYTASPYLTSMIGPRARAATVRISPRGSDA